MVYVRLVRGGFVDLACGHVGVHRARVSRGHYWQDSILETEVHGRMASDATSLVMALFQLFRTTEASKISNFLHERWGNSAVLSFTSFLLVIRLSLLVPAALSFVGIAFLQFHVSVRRQSFCGPFD